MSSPATSKDCKEYHLLHQSKHKIDTLHDCTSDALLDRIIVCPFSKPIGLWLSYGDAWRNWCAQNLPKTYCFTYEAELSDDCKLATIKTPDDIRVFSKTYWCADQNSIAWSRVMEDYDGLDFPDYDSLRFQFVNEDFNAPFDDRFIWFFMIDVSSICIWRVTKGVKSFCLVETI